MERETNTFYAMKQLPDFDLSIVIPLCEQIETFTCTLPLKVKCFERNGIEVVLVIDKRAECKILDCIQKYPFVNWKVISGADRKSVV